MAQQQEHGTRPGYYVHRRRGEDPCGPCREAINAYMRENRAKNGRRNRDRERDQRRALAELRDRHRSEYEQILSRLQAEREALNLLR